MVEDGKEHGKLSEGRISEVLDACRFYVHSDGQKLRLDSFLCQETEEIGWNSCLLYTLYLKCA